MPEITDQQLKPMLSSHETAPHLLLRGCKQNGIWFSISALQYILPNDLMDSFLQLRFMQGRVSNLLLPITCQVNTLLTSVTAARSLLFAFSSLAWQYLWPAALWRRTKGEERKRQLWNSYCKSISITLFHGCQQTLLHSFHTLILTYQKPKWNLQLATMAFLQNENLRKQRKEKDKMAGILEVVHQTTYDGHRRRFGTHFISQLEISSISQVTHTFLVEVLAKTFGKLTHHQIIQRLLFWQ